MDRQNGAIHRVTFAGQGSLILIPPAMMEQVISRSREGAECSFALDEFYPPDLMGYLRQVLETNRHLPLFSPGILHRSSVASRLCPDCACETIPGMDEIFLLTMIQLGSLHIDQRSWFSRLEYTQDGTGDGDHRLLAGYTEEAQKIGRQGGSFFYGNTGYKKGRAVCILAPAS